MTNGWRAGAARVPFPVAVGTPMAGYAARTGPAIGTVDELTIGVLYLEFGQSRFVLVAVDLVAIDTALVDEVAAAAQLDRAELVLCASHTHSGPAGVIARLHPGDDDQRSPELRNRFVQACFQAIEKARVQIEPVELVFDQQETHGLAANRNDPAGLFDPRVSVLATCNRTGQFTAMLVHFACHPTILSAANRLLSADFPGALRTELESRLEQHGRSPVVLFANGAAGDTSTRFTRTSQDRTEVDRVGRGLAAAATESLASVYDVGEGIGSASVVVSLESRSMDVPPAPIGDQSEPEEIRTHLSEAARRKSETRAQGALLLSRLDQAGSDAIQNNFELSTWRLGDIGLVAIPGELFASLGFQITAGFPTPVLVLGYANGYVGYLPDAEAHAASTYEALASPFTPSTGDTVVQAATTLVAECLFPQREGS